MPPKLVNELARKLEELDKKLTDHLIEGGSVKAKLEYHDRLLWAAITMGGTAAAGVLVQLFLMITKH